MNGGIKELIRTPAKWLMSAIRWQKSALQNTGKPVPIFAAVNPSAAKGLKIHLGAGEINLQGWINVDARPLPHIHAQTSSLALAEFADGAVGAIYMCHVLEHLSFDESTALIQALHGKLADGGAIMISVPDFDAIVRIYAASGNDLETIKHPLMGGQGYEYNFHKSVYNRAALEKLLIQCGFDDPSPWETVREFGCEIGDWSSVMVKMGNGETVSISLNVKARKRTRV